ncbi:AraC family transcriptional regulator [Rhizorhabdus dicambivorans]|uniref:AraC family transcriptional regulator n=2 Tax=Rhizorhabdus dicambivorans TaxID=1850238 RepID=A0A2A4FS55_9SPHN|nr:AraC family transcriptional regulator [Rhizorhabdus dicambivorans]PCE40550.1 AraC family transcriptional regulator [Rhizorhabdus dicambivorans]
MDPMSDVLAGMHVRSFGYGRLEIGAPWGVSYERHDASLGMILEGDCLLSIGDSGGLTPLSAGDCFLIVHGDAHALRDNAATPLIPFRQILKDRLKPYGGSGARTVLIGGWFNFDELSSHPLTKLLPPMIHISAAQAAALGLGETLTMMARETSGSAPGARSVVSRLAEVLFIQMVRAYVATEMNDRPGWLGALGDRAIGSALRLMHMRPAQAWTVKSLADEIGLSRSAFAHRFRALVGEAPMEYLTTWRMHKACRLLRGSDQRLGEIAHLVGYDSDAAFNRAFKRALGVSPGQYRTSGARHGFMQTQEPIE